MKDNDVTRDSTEKHKYARKIVQVIENAISNKYFIAFGFLIDLAFLMYFIMQINSHGVSFFRVAGVIFFSWNFITGFIRMCGQRLKKRA
jgi:hypothetical protein